MTIMVKAKKDKALNDPTFTDEIQPEKGNLKSSWNEWPRLAHMVQKISTNLEEVSLLNTVMEYAIQITNAERGFLVLINEYGVSDFRVAYGMEGHDIATVKATISKSVIDKVVKKKFPFIENGILQNSDKAHRHLLGRIGITSAICVPILTKNQLIGVVYVDSCSRTNIFANQDLVNLDAFINLASIAIDNAKLFHTLSQTTQNYVTLKEYHERILKSLPIGEIVINEDGLIEYMNEFAQKLWNVKSDEIIGKHFVTFFPEENYAKAYILELWKKYRAGKKDVSCNISLGNNTYQVYFSDVLWWGRNKVRTGLLIIDIPLHIPTNKELVDQDKQATVIQLAGGIAHEVNNLLGIIMGRTELLQLRIGQLAKELSQNVGGDFKVIFNQAKKLQKIVEDLRRLSKPHTPEMVPTDVGECITTAADVLSSSAGRIKQFQTDSPNATYSLKLKIEPNLPKIMGDSQSLEQMFINLILNAADAVKANKGGRITLRTYAEDGYVVATVEDTGIGIPADIVDRVFEPYFTTKGPKHGTGLGMPIIQRIADIHRAAISLNSKEGDGTTITITFPMEYTIHKILNLHTDPKQDECVV
ncbi:hypothetical protein AMJ86_05285 [bacterium SM23_57]|nr:MAG: hypothetical protein AMJ86_05285 [bacterium SM23_57]